MGVKRAIGLMSGTSADGVDAALIVTDGERIEAFGPCLTVPYAEGLRQEVLAVMADPARAEHDKLLELEAALTAANVEAVRLLMQETGPVDVVGMHGQTVLHRPERHFTRQLGDGAAVAQALGVAVVDRFRHADVAAGGEGAPLAPVFHRALLRSVRGGAAVLNLGGVANVTYWDGQTLLAFDTGPASALLDDWMRLRTGAPFDADGAAAAAGRVHEPVVASMLAHRYFERRPPKSLDRNAFSLKAVAALSLEDGAATLAAFTVRSVARALEHLPAAPSRWLVGGGGRHNRALMAGLQQALGVVDPVEAVGWDGDALEAQAFGFLAVRTLQGLPLSYPGTTGVPGPTLGGVVHGVAGGAAGLDSMRG